MNSETTGESILTSPEERKNLKQMEQKKQIHLSDGELPALSSNHPWLVSQNLEPEDDDTGDDQTFYTVHDPASHHRCRVPELVGRCIRACFHGWMILSKHPHDVEWSLWNPLTSKTIDLPPLVLQDGDSDDIDCCCLSSPPDDPGSVLLLTRDSKPNIVFCRLDHELRWIEISYSEQLTSITAEHDRFLLEPTCCNGKVYAWIHNVHDVGRIIQIHIAAEENEVSLLPFGDSPYGGCNGDEPCVFLRGSCAELFLIAFGTAKGKPVDAYLYKLDMSSMAWIEMEDLKDTIIFVDVVGHDSVYSNPAIASKLSGYVHFLNETDEVIYSYHVKDKTISMSSMHCLDLPPSSEASTMTVSGLMPDLRLQGDNGEAKQDEIVVRSTIIVDSEVKQNNRAHVLNIPFDVLENIMKFCVGIEYLNFRATCKLCRLAAPAKIQWSNERMRLQSPWLMALDKKRGIMTFTDPMFGDNKYLIKASPELFYDDGEIMCSRYGWLLLLIEDGRLAFFNPFTSDIRKLPQTDHQKSVCFSAPPTSPDCMVVGFSTSGPLYIHFVAREPKWHIIELDFDGDDSYTFRFPTCCGGDVYAMHKDGGLQVFEGIADFDNFSWRVTIHEAPGGPRSSSTEYFQSKCDQDHLLVIVGEFGESVEVFKLNDNTQEWAKIDSLGKHMIYICDATCVCMDAKTPEMGNKIYFPRLSCENEKIVFYSMETRMYHTFNGRNVEQNNLRDLCGSKRRTIYTHAWIEPTWS